MKYVNEEYLLSKGFVKFDSMGWAKFRKKGFELVEIPLIKGGFVIGFEYQFKNEAKYKYPITITELENLYKFLTKLEI